jgi:hypothetical protein
MTVELAWRRRKREAAERRLAARRHSEQLRALVLVGALSAPHAPSINGRSAWASTDNLMEFIAVMAAEVRK